MIITEGVIDSLLKKPLKERSRFPSHWLSGRQIAKELGLNYETTVFVWIAEKSLEARRIGRGWLVDPKKLEEFLATHQEFGLPKPERAPEPEIKPKKEPAPSDETSFIVPPVNPNPPADPSPIPSPSSTPVISGLAAASPQIDGDADRFVSIRLRPHGFRTDEVARALGFEKPTVERWIKDEVVTAKVRGEEIYIEPESLRRFLLKYRKTRITVFTQTGNLRWPT